MLRLRRANMLQIFKLNKTINYLNSHIDKFDFYSNFKGNLFSYIIQGNVYFVMKKNDIKGVVIVNKWDKTFHYIPSDNKLSIFRVLHIINSKFNIKDYKLTLKYKKINTPNLKSVFPISIEDNMMYMHINILNGVFNIDALDYDNNALLVRKLLINKEESIRVDLQNRIFNNIENRTPLTLSEVLNEINNPRFLSNFCYIFEVHREPVGYGQILKFKDRLYLVNFGIITEYRKKGYGFYFLSNILRDCKKEGIRSLYLSVDKNNENAINLYKRIGFNEIYNMMTIKFK